MLALGESLGGPEVEPAGEPKGRVPWRISAINDLAAAIQLVNISKGFERPAASNMERYLLLVVSEITEAQNELRDGHSVTEVYYEQRPEGAKPCGFPVEIADAIIRLIDILQAVGANAGAVIEEKLAFNRLRPEKHGRQF